MLYNNVMVCHLSSGAILRWLETPAVYKPADDELYELDDQSFAYLKRCATPEGCPCEENEFVQYCLAEGILTPSKAVRAHPPIVKSPTPSLRYLELQITEACNLRCRHCYIGTKGSAELDLRDLEKILTEFEEMQGLRVLLTGGEPLLHSRFSRINEMLPDFSPRKVLFTNGLLLREEILRNLHVDEIQISVDGLEEAHDSVRGKGTFRPTIDAVRLAIKHGFAVSISTMAHSKNLHDFDEMELLFAELGIKDWTVDIPCEAGRLSSNKDMLVSLEDGGRCLRYGYGGGLHSPAPGYACGLHLMSVSAEGKTARCTFYSNRSPGDIKEGLRSCWQRIRPIRSSELKCDCDMVELCRGGCRYRAETLGDPLGRDLYRCSLYAIMKKEKESGIII